MNIKVIGKAGIKFEVELDVNDRKIIKEDFDENIKDIKNECSKVTTDHLLNEIHAIL